MKGFILVLAMVLMFSMIAEASTGFWYVIKENGKVVVKCKYEPSIADLETRNEIAVFSEKDFSLSQVEYKKGKLTKIKKTPQQISAEIKAGEKRTEEKFIRDEMRKETIKRLRKNGHKFRYID